MLYLRSPLSVILFHLVFHHLGCRRLSAGAGGEDQRPFLRLGHGQRSGGQGNRGGGLALILLTVAVVTATIGEALDLEALGRGEERHELVLLDVDFAAVHVRQQQLHVTGVDVLEVDDGMAVVGRQPAGASVSGLVRE